MKIMKRRKKKLGKDGDSSSDEDEGEWKMKEEKDTQEIKQQSELQRRVRNECKDVK